MPDVVAYIGMGSNLGEPLQQLSQAVLAMQKLPGTTLVAMSSCYRSAAQTVSDDDTVPDYLNAVACLQTGLEPFALLDALQAIESAQGRVRSGDRWQARTLDLDILLYGNEIIDTPRLKVPHPEMKQRDFVLVPLAEIAPTIEIPGFVDVQTLLADCTGFIIEKLPAGIPSA